MDIEFTQFQISTMEQYIPDKLNYILVFQMPWVLNGELPAAKVRKMAKNDELYPISVKY